MEQVYSIPIYTEKYKQSWPDIFRLGLKSWFSWRGPDAKIQNQNLEWHLLFIPKVDAKILPLLKKPFLREILYFD